MIDFRDDHKIIMIIHGSNENIVEFSDECADGITSQKCVSILCPKPLFRWLKKKKEREKKDKLLVVVIMVDS